ncbi:helix-turn-helix domain-containing protein [Pseudogulbenkiania subflava]|uniref:Transcriptional regulator, XRE family with cupin sensor n=1 Tax=Pseudogulbenkiania subflava DSM 22618 TaxID=1123014 RepID=A0A1Y6B5B0_9NEIS|nr:XRE family transcriptional regulator [Pseudogulbenkiania subflava]SME93030.1 transcriptional regulator, XRE family with cupin sensor [Pseudogulbenkiania subflava DSM 22618]
MTNQLLGQRLRRYRREANKTLLEVASAAGVSVGFLSQAERNLTGVSISSLANIAKALDVPLSALFEQPAQPAPDSHQGQREAYTIENQPQRYERLSTSFPGSMLNAVKMIMPVGYCSEVVSHEGDEFVYVLTGVACYVVEGQEYRLATGDSLHFDAHRPHSVANAGDGPVELISVGTMRLFDDIETFPGQGAGAAAVSGSG